MELHIEVNGRPQSLTIEPNETLLEVLRERLNLIGAKASCEEGCCGSCTVHIDRRPVNSCITLAGDLEGRRITTIEGLASGENLHAMQQAFIDGGGLQCGYCTPGMIMAAVRVIEDAPDDEAAWRECLSGNICRCTGYMKILDSMALAAHSRRPGRDRRDA